MSDLLKKFIDAAERLDESRLDEPSMFILLRRVLILFSAFAFVVFFIEIYLAHYIWLQLFLQKFVWSFAMTPLIFAPIGLVISLVAAFRLSPKVVLVFRTVMFLSLVVGVAGTVFHIVPRIESGASLFSLSLWLGDPPVLAPAAFAFPGIMGLMAAYRIRWRKTVVEPVEERGLTATVQT